MEVWRSDCYGAPDLPHLTEVPLAYDLPKSSVIAHICLQSL